MSSTMQNRFVLQGQIIQELLKNKNSTDHWQQQKKMYDDLSKNLKFYVSKMKHSVLVPVGKKALISAEMIHTNEILVAIGGDWFVKVCHVEALSICERRTKLCEESIKNLQKEKKLLESRINFANDMDTFAADERQEIMEEYDEKKEKEWRGRHREKVKEHRQKLAEAREKLKGVLNPKTEEDIMKRLDLWEMQEELEDELERLEVDSDDTIESSDESEKAAENNKRKHTNRNGAANNSVTFNKKENIVISDVIEKELKNSSPVHKVSNSRTVSKFTMSKQAMKK